MTLTDCVSGVKAAMIVCMTPHAVRMLFMIILKFSFNEDNAWPSLVFDDVCRTAIHCYTSRAQTSVFTLPQFARSGCMQHVTYQHTLISFLHSVSTH